MQNMLCYSWERFLSFEWILKGVSNLCHLTPPAPRKGHTEMIAVNRKLDDARKSVPRGSRARSYCSAFSRPVLQKFLVSGVHIHWAFTGRVSERGWQESRVLQRRSQRAVCPCHLIACRCFLCCLHSGCHLRLVAVTQR